MGQQALPDGVELDVVELRSLSWRREIALLISICWTFNLAGGRHNVADKGELTDVHYQIAGNVVRWD